MPTLGHSASRCRGDVCLEPTGLRIFNMVGVREFLEVNALPALVYIEVDSVRETVEKLRARGIKIVNELHVVFPELSGIFDTRVMNGSSG